MSAVRTARSADGAVTGIRVYTYDPSTGAVTDNGFLTTAITDTGRTRRLQDSRPADFAIDYSIVAGGSGGSTPKGSTA
jgi:hypothetical protein